MSQFQNPPGAQRDYASPRKYTLDLVGNVATEVWNYPASQNIHCPFCSSIYEDQPLNYLIDYAFVNGGGPPNIPTFAQLVGLAADGSRIFYYQYPTQGCNTAYNSLPIHLESTSFRSGASTINLSTRGMVSVGEGQCSDWWLYHHRDPAQDVSASRARAIAQRLWAFRCAQRSGSEGVSLPALSSQPTTTGSPIQTTL